MGGGDGRDGEGVVAGNIRVPLGGNSKSRIPLGAISKCPILIRWYFQIFDENERRHQ